MQEEVKIPTGEELLRLPSGENNEPLIDVRTYNSLIIAKYEKMDMLPYAGEQIYVRETVAKMLAEAQNILHDGNRLLKIVYGYRHPVVQRAYFEKRRAELKALHPELTSEVLDSATHQFVAMPEVAGHPTGGAIDITIVDTQGNDLDLGTRIADFSDPEKIKTYAAGLSEIQEKNRLLLRDLLVKVGFAPFYGEWWHFSYGDREWAHFYGKPSSLYSAIDFRVKE